jgi:hypothetical protein
MRAAHKRVKSHTTHALLPQMYVQCTYGTARGINTCSRDAVDHPFENGLCVLIVRYLFHAAREDHVRLACGRSHREISQRTGAIVRPFNHGRARGMQLEVHRPVVARPGCINKTRWCVNKTHKQGKAIQRFHTLHRNSSSKSQRGENARSARTMLNLIAVSHLGRG